MFVQESEVRVDWNTVVVVLGINDDSLLALHSLDPIDLGKKYTKFSIIFYFTIDNAMFIIAFLMGTSSYYCMRNN